MLFQEVFLGEASSDGALDWGGDYDLANVPARIGPLFPAKGAKVRPYELVFAWVACGRLEGRRVDWGAFAAAVTRSDVAAFVDACYGRDGAPAELLRLVMSLAPGRRYALIASEG